MSAGLRLGVFGVGLALVFIAAFGLGRAIGAVGSSSPEPDPHGTHEVTR